MHQDATTVSKMTIIKAAVIIQKWYRRFRARLELKRRTAWAIYRNMEHATDTNFMRLLHGAFTNMMQLNATKDGPAQSILVSNSTAKLFSERLSQFGEKADRDLAATTGFEDIVVENDYNGIHLTFPLGASHVKMMIETFNDTSKPSYIHAKYLLQLAHEVRLVLKTKPNINEVSTSISKQVTVVGDVHGSLLDLLTIFFKNGLPDVTNPYVFNGDFVDRGPFQVLVIALLFACLLVWPNSIFLNRGNHEDFVMNNNNGFHKQLIVLYPRQYAIRLMTLFNEVFTWLPLATIIDGRIFVTHGGISSDMDLNSVRQLRRHKFVSLCEFHTKPKPDYVLDPKEVKQVTELLWSDPRPQRGTSHNDIRKFASFFGPDVTEGFLKRHGLSMVVRSHECFPEGYQFCHNNKLLTVFSISNYDAVNGNKAAMVKFDCNGEPHFIQWVSSMDSLIAMNKRPTALDDSALRTLRAQIAASKTGLVKKFQRLEKASSKGCVTCAEWCDVMKSTLLPSLPWRLLQKELTKVNEKGLVVYATTFDQVEIKHSDTETSSVTEMLYRNKGELEAVFRMIDKDCVGYVSLEVFKDCCKLAYWFLEQKELTEDEINKMASMVDLNKDGKIDYNEFLEAFRIVDTRPSTK